MRIAVVGLGILGASVARCLAASGAEVVVLERTAPLSGTSGTSFAWTNSHRKNPTSYHDLNVTAMAEHNALANVPAPGPAWLAQTGNIEWATDQSNKERLTLAVEELIARDYPVEWITPARARELVPDLHIPTEVDDIAYYPSEGYVIPALLLARLWGEARDHGAQLRCPAEVIRLDERASSVHVELTDDTLDVDMVVTTTGRWTETLTATTGQRIPMVDPNRAGSAPVGFLGYTNALPTRLDRVLTTPGLNVRPDGGGRLVLQGLDLDADADPTNPPHPEGAYARQLCSRLTTLLDGTSNVHIETMRVGQRAMPADGLPVAGFLNDSGRIYTLATHSGITLGPLLGKLAARELLTDSQHETLAEFRPQRLIDKDDTPPPAQARFAGEQ